MNTDPHWTAYLSALLTPTVAILGALIAYRQWRLAQNKLKLDLFDRRYRVYEAARSFLASIMTSGKAGDDKLFEFNLATRDAKWLLDPPVANYLRTEIYDKAIDLQILDAELVGVGVGEERSRNVQAQAELKKWFMRQFDVLDDKFSPFLQLQH
jgi:hypothetical protein